MIAAKWYDMVVGVDIHVVMVPTPAGPVPTPLPHPFAGLIFDPAGFAIGSVLSGGAVLINSMPCANTGTEGTNKLIMPHIPTPPGVAWAPIPAAPKPPVPGKPPAPPVPTPMPSNDTVLITGSKTVHIGGTNACRLGDLAMDCAEPVRIPNGTVIAVPMGMPVLVGGPPALDLISGLMAAVRTKWVTGALRRLTRAAEGSWRAKFICLLTGHPVDVASGMMLTDAVDFHLPGPIPIAFERTYHSRGAGWNGPLGYGWGHVYDQSIRFDQWTITLRAGDGRELYFEAVGPGGRTRNVSEGMDLARYDSEIHVTGRDGLTYVFAPSYREDGSWPLHQIRNPRGQRIALRYDDRGRLVEMTDSADRLIRIQNDAQGRIAAIRLPNPDRPGAFFDAVRYAYDAEGDLVEARDALGEPIRYFYKHHLMVQETQRNGLSFYFAYDGITPDARCVRTWGDGGIFDHVLTYDSTSGITVKEDSYGHRTVYKCNEAGLVEEIIDSLGRTRKYAYDDGLRRVSETDGEGNVFEIAYDGRGRISRMADADGVSRELVHDEFDEIVEEVLGGDAQYRHVFNRFGELVASRDPDGNGVMQEIDDRGDIRVIRTRGGTRADLAWDEQHNLVRVEVSGEAPLGARYDGLGRIRAVFLPDGHTVSYELDLNGRPVAIQRSWLGTDRFEYDPSGLVLRHTGPGGGTVHYEYTNYNRIAAIRSSSGERHFEYNLEGDVTAVVNERGERYVLERDSEGQLVAETDFTGLTRRYRLDKAGRPIEVIESDGKRVKHEWTPGGRLARIEYADGTFDAFTYDTKGEVVAAENENGTIERAFDPAGRLVREAFGDFVVEHAYDRDGQRVNTRASDGTRLDFDYDEGGRLSQLRADDRWELRRTFDAMGLLQEVERPGRVVERLRYDGNGWPLEQHVTAGNGDYVAYRRYEFNAAGFLAAQYDSVRGLRTYAFGPGGLERVLRDGRVEESYVHDVAGDWFPADQPSEAGPGGRIERFGDIRYEYDGRGRIIRRTQAGRTWEFSWSDRGQLIATKTPDGRDVRYAYDPFWRRIRRDDGEVETHWAWDGQAPVRERRIAGGSESRRAFVFEPDGHTPLLALEEDRCAGFVGDHIGTPQEVVSSHGDVLWAGDYSAFGNLLRARSADFDNPFRFQGQWFDDETGLHYNRFRYYDPQTGRYLSPDPIRLAGGMSAYAYAGDPLTWVDPLGLSCGRVGEFFQSFVIFFRSGIRPKHARAIMRVARETGQTFAFRNIGSFRKRIGSFVAGLFGMRPKPMTTKAKSNAWGVATDPHTGQRFRSDYDPTFYRNADGSVMTDAQADAANRTLNDAIGGPEIQHPTHVTMPEDVAPKVGPPTESTVFHPDGTTSQMTPDQIRDSPGMPWLW